jgi:ribosomal protein L40E
MPRQQKLNMKTGEKVVCVKGWARPEANDASHKPIVGNVYVVAGVHECFETGLHLLGIEVPHYCRRCGGAVAWRASHFRKLDEMKLEAKQSQKQQEPQVA